jgi:L-lactate utilization protein LutC
MRRHRREGKRIITLIPDLHICVVRAAQVVQTVPGAPARLDPSAHLRQRPPGRPALIVIIVV